ncbi:class I SAM-dependent methyltransferase [Mesorhizobium caraganae]|uniref:class I SAM-dependent methyltransferase n=1 Tax=Mesorhizobium caraganae TaxID=483206 RepID=UPI00333826CC
MTTYEERIAAQIEQYRAGVNVHALPDIFHYWANQYLRPQIIQLFGAVSIAEIFALPIIERAKGKSTVEVLSIGSGDCSVEIEVATILRDRIGTGFRIYATELSPILIKQANSAIAATGLSDCLVCLETDLNTWTSKPASFDVAMVSHSLHHIVELEHVFLNVQQALRPGGVFCISDMIGRNGHMRWPEALEIMQKFWAILPEGHKYNHLLTRTEPAYINFDCSGEGFEGIRAQDILPLLLQRFYPGKFLAAGGLTDVFVDRAFGHNFDPKNNFDRNFIDLVHHVNELLLRAGVLTPTQLFAYFHVGPAKLEWVGTPPDRAVRWPYADTDHRGFTFL